MLLATFVSSDDLHAEVAAEHTGWSRVQRDTAAGVGLYVCTCGYRVTYRRGTLTGLEIRKGQMFDRHLNRHEMVCPLR